MARVSHSFLDPFIIPWVPRLYHALHIPPRVPPEAIIGAGHLIAIAAAFGFAYSTQWWWAAGVGALGVLGNHLADMVDGTHARRTNQCRNGGELLDHFTDPLSFSYWMIGISVSAVSQHLAKLRAYGLVANRREAQTIFYRLTDHSFIADLQSVVLSKASLELEIARDELP